MNFLDRWLNPPRTFGSSKTKQSTINDELLHLRVNEHVYDEVLTTMIGEQWNKVPVRDMMGLFNARFGGTPIDYSDKEISSVIYFMNNCFGDLSPDQIKFLHENDHLPRSKKEDGGVWLDGDELHAYARDNEDNVHKRKMDYFIMMNGALAAHQQRMDQSSAIKAPKGPFKILMVHKIIFAVFIIALIMFIIL